MSSASHDSHDLPGSGNDPSNLINTASLKRRDDDHAAIDSDQDHQRLTLLRQIGRDILSERSLRATADTALAFLYHTLPVQRVYVTLYDAASDNIYGLQTSWPGFNEPFRRPLSDYQAIHSQVMQDRLIHLPDLAMATSQLPDLQDLADVGASLLILPLEVRDEYIGALAITTAARYEFAMRDIELVREVADWLAIAVRQNNLLGEEQTLRRQQETLREVAASITAGLELDEVLRRILDQLERVLPTISSALFLRQANDCFELAAYRGLRSDLSDLNKLHETPPPHFAMMLADQQPIVIDNTRLDPNWTTIPGSEYIYNWLGVPLIVDERVIGSLTLDRDEPGSFSSADVSLASVFANQAAIAIENARLFREEQKYGERLAREVRDRTAELEALYAMSAVTGSALRLDDVLERSLAMTSHAFQAEAAAIHLLDETSQTFRLAAMLPVDNHLCLPQCKEMRPDDPICREVLAATDAWMANPAELAAAGTVDWVDSYAGAPMRASGRTIGILSLLNCAPGIFQPATVPLLSAISDRIAIAVENVQLRLRTRQTAILEERERLAMELHDSVTQQLYGVLLFAAAAAEAARTGDSEALHENLSSTRSVTQHAMGELRLLLYGLRSETLARAGLVEALRYRLNAVERRAGLDVQFQAEGELADLPPLVEEALLGAGQEALSNALRHAHATAVTVSLRQAPSGVFLRVADNGRGLQLDQMDERAGQGLLNMQRRMATVGGTVTIGLRKAGGTEVQLWAPLPSAPREAGGS